MTQPLLLSEEGFPVKIGTGSVVKVVTERRPTSLVLKVRRKEGSNRRDNPSERSRQKVGPREGRGGGGSGPRLGGTTIDFLMHRVG